MAGVYMDNVIRKSIRLLVFATLALCVFGADGFAQLSPGDLHATHESLEGLKNCEKCHEAGNKITGQRCLECHTLLRSRIDKGRGLHAGEGFRECVSCHVEHLGRDGELVWWKDGREKFDHTLTGYNLSGKHATLDCRKCHTEKNVVDAGPLAATGKNLERTYLGLSPDCLNCHTDEHRGLMAKDCSKCHNFEKWKPAPKFDHDIAKYKLTGRHVNTPCEKCHTLVVDNRNIDDPDYLKFAGVKYSACIDCHEVYHKSGFDRDCSKCHSPAGWHEVNRAKFNHTDTRYQLAGKHMDVKCDKCHAPGKPMNGLKFALCTDCHNDYHRGQFAGRQSKGECAECHSVNGFSPALFGIDIHNKTDYPLTGSHLAIPCLACHSNKKYDDGSSGPVFVFKSTRCLACHKDPHKGELNKFVSVSGCEGCHSVDGWMNVAFDHDSTGFKLEGRHKAAMCRKCHQTINGNDILGELTFKGRSGICSGCHEDKHRRQFAVLSNEDNTELTDCGRCHNSANWKPDKFDHNIASSFKLEGSHVKTPCGGCHKEVAKNEISYILYKPIDPTCQNCHGQAKKAQQKGALDE